MRVLGRLSTAQRLVVVVGLGLAMAAGWAWWYAGRLTPTGGWFAYSPGSQATETYVVVRERQASDLVGPLALIGVWTAASVGLFGLGRHTAAIADTSR